MEVRSDGLISVLCGFLTLWVAPLQGCVKNLAHSTVFFVNSVFSGQRQRAWLARGQPDRTGSVAHALLLHANSPGELHRIVEFAASTF